MQSNNDVDAEKGWIAIEDATLQITAALDGIQAETRLTVSGGDLALSTGGGGANSSSQAGWGDWGRPGAPNNDDTGDSAKGLKAGVEVTILGGTIHVDASDDAIHSNDRLAIGGGEMVLASGDDGVHADSALEIDGGDLTITQSYEGIESATITINDGTIHVVSSDDGINAAGGRDGSAVDGRPGQNRFEFGGDHHLYLNGGYVVVDAMGDGLDINGPIDMTGGTVIVNGPTANNNGALDCGGAFNISGGLVVAVGSSGMAQAPSMSSTQYSVIYNFQSPQAAGTLFHVETDKGQELLTVAPTKAYQSVVLSSPELQNGATYVIYTGGRSTGTLTDSLYAGGTYTPGTKVASLQISDITTAVGAAGGFGGGPGRGGMRPPGGGGGGGRRP